MFAPAGLSNATPVLVSKIPFLKKFNQPIDFGKTFRGKRIFGAHKTIRGLVAGTLIGGLIGLIQGFAYSKSSYLQEISPLDFFEINSFMFGALLGFGVLAGDAIESFIKRQIGVEPGKSWFPFDQIDYIIGALFVVSFYYLFPWYIYMITLLVWFSLHLIVSYAGYLVKLKDDPI